MGGGGGGGGGGSEWAAAVRHTRQGAVCDGLGWLRSPRWDVAGGPARSHAPARFHGRARRRRRPKGLRPPGGRRGAAGGGAPAHAAAAVPGAQVSRAARAGAAAGLARRHGLGGSQWIRPGRPSPNTPGGASVAEVGPAGYGPDRAGGEVAASSCSHRASRPPPASGLATVLLEGVRRCPEQAESGRIAQLLRRAAIGLQAQPEVGHVGVGGRPSGVGVDRQRVRRRPGGRDGDRGRAAAHGGPRDPGTRVRPSLAQRRAMCWTANQIIIHLNTLTTFASGPCRLMQQMSDS